MDTPFISVIIVTWNGMRHLPACLEALVPQLPAAAELIHVDNGSADGTPAWVREHYPTARQIALATNTGFAGGVAAGLAVARGELVLLINDDAFAEAGFLVSLVEGLQRSGAASASAVLLFDHMPQLVASAGIRIRRDGLALDLLAGLPAAELPTQPFPILGPSGGAVLYRRSALDDAGGMDARFFAYLEDVDLALRLRLRGHESVCVPQARARHVYSATGGQGSPFKQRLLGRNRLRVLIRCLPAPLFWRMLPAMLLYDLLAVAYTLLQRQTAPLFGRVQALGELGALLYQRQRIQARSTIPARMLWPWFETVPWPWETMGETRELAQILSQRETPTA